MSERDVRPLRPKPMSFSEFLKRLADGRDVPCVLPPDERAEAEMEDVDVRGPLGPGDEGLVD